MTGKNLYLPFEVDFKELEQFPKTIRKNNFFELIYVVDGTGIQIINDNTFQYQKGNLFLITPQDVYSFEILTPTKFFFLRFNEYYIKTNSQNGQMETVLRMEYILQNASHRPGCILKNHIDKPLIASLIESIINEQTNQQIYHQKVTEQIVNTIITVVARNIALKLPKNIKETTGEMVLEILHYIQENIYDPKQLKAEIISEHFNISLHYLGKYFKKQTGETLQEYISNYKLRLIEARLLNSDMRINEIADELHFSDESHLNKVFRKHRGMNPSEFRKKRSN
ncbi:helix-turn-helix domain-containing protein [Flavobacterium sp. ANB]|uniref:AraC family transcriptional regulator n=1 Tax=unclassified Flavobacterium TaxID=196869 RepID=UPI0012B88F7C|nr:MULTISPECIES: AraC family transcriptional regulator [unclassified Flavobacterium]MBF4517256.1 helix-turn-helix domain-containing protein [Flavobacterium sp. ANB]MTD70633.1 helix-turn-helix domain-containing protein [Flavobacterium sp. LC2016-13]